jgi:hypothetical protein
MSESRDKIESRSGDEPAGNVCLDSVITSQRAPILARDAHDSVWPLLRNTLGFIQGLAIAIASRVELHFA